LAALAAFLSPVGSGVPRAVALPSATNAATYAAYGRVFPDPQGCTKGTPGSSPWAKGNVCAAQFLQWDETLAGLKYLQQKFPRFGRLVNLHDLKQSVPEFANVDMQTAGLPQADLSRDRRDLYVFVVTDRESPVSLADRHRYAYSLSIHGIERAGVEGGVRAAEDLVTWGATAPNTRILEPTNSGPTAGQVLKDNVLYFVLSNPDGWGRGEVSKGGVYFQRYNGDGADLNREFPGVGYSNPVYTPFAEPEATSLAAYLLREKSLSSEKSFRGALDLHGMAGADSFSFTLLSGTAKSWAVNTQITHSAQAIYQDAVKRLSYSPLIADPANCPGDIPVFLLVSEGSAPMCPDQWGSVWDTINYQTTGAIGDWFTMDIGLGATGVDNEMAYSHVVPNTAFIPAIEQLHVDGNKGIIYSQLAALTNPAPVPAVNVTAGFAPSVNRKVRAASAPSPAVAPLRVQSPLHLREMLGQGVEFDVAGPEQGVSNGGLTAEFSFTNIDGISPETASDVRLERYGHEHPGDPDGWNEVGSWFRQELTYFPAGARIDINNPTPGRYRLAPAPMLRHGVTNIAIRFTPDKVIPKPNTAYNVANTDVFNDLGPNIHPITPTAVLKNAHVLDGVSSYILADDPAPGVAAADRAAWFAALKNYVNNGGNLVLTDRGLDALADLGVVPSTALIHGVEYGGWISFTDADNRLTFGTHPLTARLDLPGAATGSDSTLDHRRQTYDPGGVGYRISESIGQGCLTGLCDAPQVLVNTDAWRKAGGTVVGRAGVVHRGGGSEVTGTTYGELPLGRGRIRIVGGLLPTPTEANDHPYGLLGYSLSWTGWQVLVNLVSVSSAAPAPTNVLGITTIPRTGGAQEGPLDLAAVAITLAALVRFARARRRLHPLS
ncbi:MAG: hypothetical protein QOF21_73, partial [Actinomycetota bacterium]